MRWSEERNMPWVILRVTVNTSFTRLLFLRTILILLVFPHWICSFIQVSICRDYNLVLLLFRSVCATSYSLSTTYDLSVHSSFFLSVFLSIYLFARLSLSDCQFSILLTHYILGCDNQLLPCSPYCTSYALRETRYMTCFAMQCSAVQCSAVQ